MYDKKLVLAGIAIFILQACSGSGSDSAVLLEDENLLPDLEGVEQIGILELDSEVDSPSKSVFAQFLTLEDRADPAADIVSLVNLALPPAGSCSLESESPLFDPDPDLFFSFASDVTTIDVGETITLSSDAGTYATIERRVRSGTRAGETSYRDDLSIAGPFPESLRLNISDSNLQTSDGIPLSPMASGAAVAIDPPEIDMFNPQVFTDTVFQLQTSNSFNGQRIVVIRVQDGSLILNHVICTLPGNESFTLPEETVALLRERNETTETSIGEQIGDLDAVGFGVVDVVRDGDTVFIIRHLHVN